jgi:hypothetical protein
VSDEWERDNAAQIHQRHWFLIRWFVRKMVELTSIKFWYRALLRVSSRFALVVERLTHGTAQAFELNRKGFELRKDG